MPLESIACRATVDSVLPMPRKEMMRPWMVPRSPQSVARLARLVSRKKATVRRAMCSADVPLRLSAQAPSARPPAPPAGSSEFAASSAIPMS